MDCVLRSCLEATKFWADLGIPISKKASFGLSVPDWIQVNYEAYEIHSWTTP